MPQGWGPPTGPTAGGTWSRDGRPASRPPWRLGGAGSNRSGVPNYLIWAILCTVLFSPIGVVGIVYSIIANRRAGTGDIDGALRASKVARMWCWISLIIGLAGLLLVGSGVIAYPLKV